MTEASALAFEAGQMRATSRERRFKPYPAYKDSVVEWQREIPAHWRLVPGTWLLTESKRRALEADEQLSATQKYGLIPQAEFERLEELRTALISAAVMGKIDVRS